VLHLTEGADAVAAWSPNWSHSPDEPGDQDQPADRPDQHAGTVTTTGPRHRTVDLIQPSGPATSGTGRHLSGIAPPQKELALRLARDLADAGKPVSRRVLRHGGVKGSNEALNALARMVNAELADK
jgi:hypothetical protein